MRHDPINTLSYETAATLRELVKYDIRSLYRVLRLCMKFCLKNKKLEKNLLIFFSNLRF